MMAVIESRFPTNQPFWTTMNFTLFILGNESFDEDNPSERHRLDFLVMVKCGRRITPRGNEMSDSRDCNSHIEHRRVAVYRTTETQHALPSAIYSAQSAIPFVIRSIDRLYNAFSVRVFYILQPRTCR
jgi:hypothetical protein